MTIEETRIYTTKEVADILRVSLPTIKRMLKDGRLKSTRIGRQHRFLGRDLLDIMGSKSDLRHSETIAPSYPARPSAPPTARPSYAPAPISRPEPAPEWNQQESTLPAIEIEASLDHPVEIESQPPTTAVPAGYLQELSSVELRQRAYMLGKRIANDIIGEDGALLFRSGTIVTDDIILKAKKLKKIMDLFANLQHEEHVNK